MGILENLIPQIPIHLLQWLSQRNADWESHNSKADADDIYAVNFPEDYLQYERNDPWLSLGVKRASDPPTNVSTFTWEGANDLDFSTQEVYINPDEVLSNHGGTYKNYIKFTDNNNTNYQYISNHQKI